MEDKLKEILDDYDEQISKYEAEIRSLDEQLVFYKAHNLMEEYRICLVKYQAVHMCVHMWRNMHRDVKDLLDAWLS